MGDADHAAMLELASEMTPFEALRFIRAETNRGTSSSLPLLMEACRAHPLSTLHKAMRHSVGNVWR